MCLELRKESPRANFPDHFLPMYAFFSRDFSQDIESREQQAPTGISDEVLHDEGQTWHRLLQDGSLINLTLLANAILLSHHDVDTSSLSLCWRTLDILRSEFRITGVDVSDTSLAFFNKIHEKTRKRVEDEEPGFSVISLLEVLDAVDGGRRLSMVFQAENNHDYHPKADLVFGKDHLRNPDLFQAFAHCLPHFVSKRPEKFIELMEGLVFHDSLWTSLQFHLWNSLRPNSFIPAMLHVFDTCCTVIDTAFVALENSKVDWRATDFGSLAHYFELFVTDCFQGVFIERAVGFRVGLIKARFCRAVLAHFMGEFNREGTVVLWSHWDVASIARLFYSLGVGDDADVEFWKTFVDGGPVGPELMDKTHTSLDKAARDGRLLNFCTLGHLGMMAVPFKGSGLEHTEPKKLLALMEKIKEDSGLPLTDASTRAWEELCQLRYEVADACKRISKEDKANIDKLLEKIDTVYSQRPSSMQEHCPIDLVRTQASGTSATTAVIEDQRSSSPAQEVDSRGTVVVTATEFLFENPC